MWTSWLGTSATDAKANIALMQQALITGKPTSIKLAGEVVDYDPRGLGEKLSPQLNIADLQEYLWQITYNGVDPTNMAVNPRLYRAGVTRQNFG
jgi:hypothetical protein